MKISCQCGGLIVDQSDFLPYKAYLIADQDWFDVLDDAATGEQRRNLAWKLSRSIWQCPACGRLCVDDRSGTLHWFESAEPTVPRDLLASALGAQWQGNLRGRWRTHAANGPSGELWWACGDGDGGLERFASRAELERRYHEEFRRLRDLDTLRSSFLRVDGTMAHQWPPAGIE